MRARFLGLTRGLMIFALGNTLALNGALLFLGSTTTLHYLAAYVLGHAAEDSWQPMRLALDYLHTESTKPVYTALFFERDIQFIYPPTSLLFLEPLRPFFPQGLPSNVFLNLVSWMAVALTALITSRLWVAAATEHLGRELEHRRGERLALAALAAGLTLAFYPILKGFRLGQIQTWMTCVFAAASLAWVNGHPRTAGALSGLMCLVKPHLGLLLVWGLLRRQRRFVEGWTLIVLPLGAWSMWLYGAANHWTYLQLVSSITRHGWSYYPNQSANGMLNRWFQTGSNLTWTPHFVPFNIWVFAGTAAAAALLIGLALFWRRAEHSEAELVDFYIVALSCTLASPLAWEHHYGILMPMFACILPATLASWRGRAGPLVLLAVSFVLSSNVYEITGRLAGTRFNVLQSYLFVGALLMLVHLYRLRRRSAAAVIRHAL